MKMRRPNPRQDPTRKPSFFRYVPAAMVRVILHCDTKVILSERVEPDVTILRHPQVGRLSARLIRNP